MPTFTIHQAKSQLSELIRRAEAGEEIIIARGDKPVATLRMWDGKEVSAKRLAGRGQLEGTLPLPPDEVLIGPMSDAELAEAFGDEYVALFDNPGAKPE